MTLRVLSVAFPFAPVDADPVGGAEQVLAHLDRHLVESGHESVVIAQRDSQVHGYLIPLPTITGTWNAAARACQHRFVRRAVAEALAHSHFDVMHCHGLDFAEYLPPVEVPLLVTLHLPLDRYPDDALRAGRPGTFLVPVSIAQTRGAPSGAQLLPPIGNGVAENPFAGHTRKGEFALALGRICPEKGFDDTVRAARAADIDLLIAGRLFPWPAHVRWFKHVLAPMLDARQHLIGVITGPRKQWLLAAARCVLINSRAHETSSLVAMEALAAGTPVIAYRRGALPDLIEDGVTGFLVDDVDGMAAAIRRIDTIDPDNCIRAARERCALSRMLQQYLELYTRLAAQTRVAA